VDLYYLKQNIFLKLVRAWINVTFTIRNNIHRTKKVTHIIQN
jgi:hypothetical protein